MGRVRLARLLVHLLNPLTLLRALWFQWNHTHTLKSETDPEMRFYFDLLPPGSEYIHLGYFDRPDRAGDEIAFEDIVRAQHNHAELLLSHLPDTRRPVLDSGCGMGGLLRELRREGYTAVGLTPDRAQIEYIREQAPDQDLIHARMEDIDTDRYEDHFGAVINLESFQFIRMEPAFDVMDRILAPNGRWIVSDAFRRGDEDGDGSRHAAGAFRQRARDRNWELVEEEDITDHVLPTLRFGHTLAERLGISAYEYGRYKFENKLPFFYRVLKKFIRRGRKKFEQGLQNIHPTRYRKRRTYRVFVLEKNAMTG